MRQKDFGILKMLSERYVVKKWIDEFTKSVNLLSVKPVLHPEEISGHWFQRGVLGGAELWWGLRVRKP